MKKLATIIAAVASLAIASPAYACPHEDKADAKTAEKKEKAKETEKAKEGDKAKTAKPAEKPT